MATIIRKVKAEVTAAYRSNLLRTTLIGTVAAVAILTMYQPTGNPNSMQKMGTPIPIPAQSVSRTTKIIRAHLGLST
jgi:hypothetical protein